MEGIGNNNASPVGYYIPIAQSDVANGVRIAVRTRGEPGAIASLVRGAVASLDSDLAIYEVNTMRTVIERQTWFYTMFGTFFMAFGICALFLAAAGLYGVMSFAVTQRTREMGVRSALGARGPQLILLVMRRSVVQLADRPRPRPRPRAAGVAARCSRCCITWIRATWRSSSRRRRSDGREHRGQLPARTARDENRSGARARSRIASPDGIDLVCNAVFIGHLALGLAAKRAVPRVSLALAFAAAQFADLLWPILVAAGIEQVRIDPGNTAFTPLKFVSYPYSHSLLFLIGWGALLGGVCGIRMRDARAAIVLGALVVSHWLLDVITHRPDMPIFPGGTMYGLELWSSIPATLGVEIVLFAAGLWIYLRATDARDRIGRWGFGALAAFLVAGYVAAVGSVPPSIPALYISALVGAAILTLWSWWADRHRTAR